MRQKYYPKLRGGKCPALFSTCPGAREEPGHESRFLTRVHSPRGLPMLMGAEDSGGVCLVLWFVVDSPGNPLKQFHLTEECLCSGAQEWPQG